MGTVTSFGELLRRHRRQCRDPDRGGMLTQERLGELLGRAMGHAGYSGAAISDWERNKSKIDEDDRLVLVALISVLFRCHGLENVSEANRLLHAGNYRALDRSEQMTIFPSGTSGGIARVQANEHPAAARSVPATEARQKLLILLDKVCRFWIEGVLSKTLAGAPELVVSWELCPERVARPWESVVAPDFYKGGDEEILADVFDNADGALLILGEAGSGKTTKLLQLADVLAQRAETDATAPVPVVLNLSTWTESRGPLVDWVATELVAKYQIPRRISRLWLEEHELVLLLDGFDEVPADLRMECVQVINQFRREYGLRGLVVCSRTAEYAATGLRLDLGDAIQLKPLTPEQQNTFLAAGGSHLAGLRQALGKNELLQELARSPLLLGVMVFAFRDVAAKELDVLGAFTAVNDRTVRAVRSRLFTAYERRMFQLHQSDGYPVDDMKGWLAWLAARMNEHDRTLFLVEEIQPDWLSGRDRRLFLLLSHLFSGVVGGLIMWLLLLLMHRIVPELPTALAPRLSAMLRIAVQYAEPIVLVAGNVALALVVAAIHALFGARIDHAGKRPDPRFLQRRAALVAMVTGLLTVAVVALVGDYRVALAWGVAEGFMYGMFSRFIQGPGDRWEIRPVEALAWSWREAGGGLVWGLLLALAAELLESSLFGYNGIWRSLLTFGVGGFFFGGLRGNRIETKNALNQGIRLSLRNSLVGAGVVAMALGSITLLVRGPAAALISTALAGLFVFPFFGGAAVLKHYLVRWFLWRAGEMPRDYDRFLEQAARFGLLRRVGGGYRFMHRLLQDHFAAQR